MPAWESLKALCCHVADCKARTLEYRRHMHGHTKLAGAAPKYLPSYVSGHPLGDAVFYGCTGGFSSVLHTRDIGRERIIAT